MTTPDYTDGCAYVDGAYVPIGEARISIMDVGFTKADATYDVVAVWDGNFFRLEQHLERFEKAWRRIHLDPPLDRDGIRRVLFECVRRTGLREAYVDMIVTRGVPKDGSRDPRTFENRFYAYAIPYVWIETPERQEKGGHLVIAKETIRIPEQSVDPTVKNFHWADLTRGIFEAYERGGQFIVLPDADGFLTEGPGFNVFAVIDGEIWTPPRGALEGITRRTVLELAEEDGIPTRVEPLSVQAALGADEIFVTSTAGGVMPMTILDGKPVGNGSPGPLTQRLRARYWDAHKEPRFSVPVDYA